jgi:CrcB protein
VEKITSSLIVGIGAAAGANARFWFTQWFTGRWTPTIPWHTLIINVSGALIVGIFMALALARGWSTGWRLLVAVGFAGGFTTFSTFAAQAVTLMEEDKLGTSLVYALLSVVLSITACFAGVHFTRIALAD